MSGLPHPGDVFRHGKKYAVGAQASSSAAPSVGQDPGGLPPPWYQGRRVFKQGDRDCYTVGEDVVVTPSKRQRDYQALIKNRARAAVAHFQGARIAGCGCGSSIGQMAPATSGARPFMTWQPSDGVPCCEPVKEEPCCVSCASGGPCGGGCGDHDDHHHHDHHHHQESCGTGTCGLRFPASYNL